MRSVATTLSPSHAPNPNDQANSHLRRVQLHGDVATRLALSEELLRDAFHLRYISYRAKNYIDEHPAHIFSDEFDHRPGSKTILAYRDDRLAASARTCLYDPEEADTRNNRTPAFALFRDEIESLVNGSQVPEVSGRAVEVTRLVRHPDFERDHHVIYALLMTIGYIILNQDAKIVYSAVRKNHIPFYRRFGFIQITDPKPYPGLHFDTALIAFIKGMSNQRPLDIRIFEEVTKDDDQYGALISGHRTPIYRGAGMFSGPQSLNLDRSLPELRRRVRVSA